MTAFHILQNRSVITVELVMKKDMGKSFDT